MAKWNKSFKSGLEYEYLFRTVSVRTFKKIIELSDNKLERDSLKIFLELENDSLKKMESIRKEYSIYTPSRIKVFLVYAYFITRYKIDSNSMYNYLEKSALKFISQLNSIKELGPDKYSSTLLYMVEHEKALHQFLKLYNDGKYQEAYSVMKNRAIQLDVKVES